MTISILTLFPNMFVGPLSESILKRATEKGVVTIDVINIRDSARDKYKSVDDHPYGGGVGMVLKVDIIDKALSTVKCQMSRRRQSGYGASATNVKCQERVVLLDPRGTTFTQKKARELAKVNHLILICGHYEGVDERVKSLIDESTSIGEYVLTGGELPAMVIVDSIVRLLPGVLKKKDATVSESFSLEIGNWKLEIPVLEYPQYTRPELYKGMRVPKVLLSGNHGAIASWRKDHTTTVRKDPASRRLRPGSAVETPARKDPDIG